MEYKFRGKVIGSDQWVYGNLLNRVDSLGPLSLIEVQDKEPPFEIMTFHVYPESVGVEASITDKTGKAIYAGDYIMVMRIFGFHSELMDEWKQSHGLSTINGIGSLFKGIVVVDIRRGLMLKRFDNDYMEPIFDRKQKQSCYLDMTTCEVFGNLIDNPINPAVKDSVNYNMKDPNLKTDVTNEEAIAEQSATGQEIAATEQEAQENAMESEEEGGTEG